MKRLNVFVAVKGHAFDRNALEAMLRACGAEPTFVDQPLAARVMNPRDLAGFDAIVLHDMWGLDFQAPRDERPASQPPPPELVTGLAGLLEQGMGILALHHAIASWPAWDDYARMLGARFLYRDGMLGGIRRGDSGYVSDVTYEMAVAANHPVTAGLPASMTLTDELYAMEILDDAKLVPLLTRTTAVAPEAFASAMRAVRRIAPGEGTPWQPPRESRLQGWAKAAGNSPVVYLQAGDGPQTFADPHYGTLVSNGLRWLCGEGREWARGQAAGT